MIIITVANQKGGVGKTTLSVALAHGLSMKGMKTLLVDLDTQGNCADALGIEEASSLFEWLILNQNIEKVIYPDARKGLDLVRSDKNTARLLLSAAGMDYRENILANALARCDYDVAILDCPPSINLLHTAALVAADLLIIPTKLDQYSVKGVIAIMQSLATVRQNTRSACTLGGIIPTFYERVTNESQSQLEVLANMYGKLVWPPISVDSSIRVASRKGLTPFEMQPKCRSISDFEKCLDRLMMAIKNVR